MLLSLILDFFKYFMLSKKKQSLNYIILMDGSSIKKKSLKKYKSFELLKDNYNRTYLSTLKNTNLFDLSEKTSISNFYKKYQTK